ncbi:hypothetical protein CEXT_187581 [Caerostris extrusa]|uniref:RNase H type-1 domain-containing protein n=1 Tax=Caerostris extrusa TaxID=172846 RepID=A0AAV4WY11_CAEEX|nr:hypothetical protein CEXT_187581 [Caerostris extrusa]
MLNILYPDPEWLRIFTNGSLLSDSRVFSEIFLSITSLLDEVLRLMVKLLRFAQLCPSCSAIWKNFTRAVILCDSRAALLTIVSDNNPKTQDILDCRYHLENLASLAKTIVLQWVPAHCGVQAMRKPTSFYAHLQYSIYC